MMGYDPNLKITMTDKEFSDIKEQQYIAGRKAAFAKLLELCGEEFDFDEKHPISRLAALIEERVHVVAALRGLCEEFGDNDWDDKNHLGDVIEKHLGRYLGDE